MEVGQWGPELCEKEEENRGEADAVRSRAGVRTPACLLWRVGDGQCGEACPASPARATSREWAQGLSRAGGDVHGSPRVGRTRVSSRRGGAGRERVRVRGSCGRGSGRRAAGARVCAARQSGRWVLLVTGGGCSRRGRRRRRRRR